MPNQWRYKSEDAEFGPISAKELKQLADRGRLKPDDLVRRDDMDKWVRAAKVQGLFTIESVPPPPPALLAVTPVSPATKGKYRWPKRIGLTLLGFYILGLVARPEDRARQGTASQSASAMAGRGKPEDTASRSSSAGDDDSAALPYLPVRELEKRLTQGAIEILPKYERLLQAYLPLQKDAKALHTEFRYANSALDLGWSEKDMQMKSLLNAEQIKGWLALREGWGESIESRLAHAKAETPDSIETQGLKHVRVYEARTTWGRKPKPAELAELDRQIAASRAQDLAKATRELRSFQALLQASSKASSYKNILDHQAKYKAIFTEVSKAVKDLEKLLKANEPRVPPELTKGTHAIVGVTHMINGDDHYLTNELNRHQCVVSIPPEQRKLISYRQLDSPNEVMIDDHFRFVGNAKGQNAFGGTVNVEMYVCDPRLNRMALQVMEDDAAYQLLYRKFHGQYTTYRASVGGLGGVLRRLTGDERFSSVVKSFGSYAEQSD